MSPVSPTSQKWRTTISRGAPGAPPPPHWLGLKVLKMQFVFGWDWKYQTMQIWHQGEQTQKGRLRENSKRTQRKIEIDRIHPETKRSNKSHHWIVIVQWRRCAYRCSSCSRLSTWRRCDGEDPTPIDPHTIFIWLIGMVTHPCCCCKEAFGSKFALIVEFASLSA